LNDPEADNPSTLNVDHVDDVRRAISSMVRALVAIDDSCCFIFSRFSAAIFLANATIPGTIKI
jgi:hypothetical protein